MTIDWNWFFSAFVQSGATIIGIVAAFIISKIIGELNVKYDTEQRYKKLLIDYESLKNKISLINFNVVDESTIRLSKNITKELGFTGLKDSERLDLLYRIEPCLFKTDKCIEVLNEVLSHTQIEEKETKKKLLTERDIKNIRKTVYNLKIEAESMINSFKTLKNLCV